MASSNEFVAYVVDQLSSAGEITTRKMFGEYAVYCDAKVIALICNNNLFIKPTDAGRAFIGTVVEAPPYPGAKMYCLIEEGLDNSDWLCELVRITCKELPVPRVKRRSSRKR